jgi:hypothetical protein
MIDKIVGGMMYKWMSGMGYVYVTRMDGHGEGS